MFRLFLYHLIYILDDCANGLSLISMQVATNPLLVTLMSSTVGKTSVTSNIVAVVL